MSAINFEEVNNKVLGWSVFFTICYTVVAVVIGLLTFSQAILFDAVTNLVGIVLTYVSVFTMKFIKKKDSWNYPFGKAVFEPFIVIVQYCIILGLCITNAFTAVQVILMGGHEMNISSGILYGFFGSVYSLAIIYFLRSISNKNPTAISELEIDQWRFTALGTVGILFGFSLALFLSRTPLVPYIAFVDPVLTLCITMFFARIAILAIGKSIKELLSGKPSEDITKIIEQKVEQVSSQYKFRDKVLRLGKSGGQIIIEIDYIIEQDCLLDCVYMQDKLRSQLKNTLTELSYEKWLNVNFSGDIKWSEHTL